MHGSYIMHDDDYMPEDRPQSRTFRELDSTTWFAGVCFAQALPAEGWVNHDMLIRAMRSARQLVEHRRSPAAA